MPMQRRLRWFQNGGGPDAHTAVASVVSKRRSLPFPLGPLSYQRSTATGHTYGGAKGTRKFSFIPLTHVVHFAPPHYP